MWIAIAYERVTTVITWNLAATHDEVMGWVLGNYYPHNMSAADTDEAALKVIESLGYDVQIELIEHLVTTTEYAIRLPNEFVIKRTDDEGDAADNEREANQKLRAAGSPELVTLVSRQALHTNWREAQL